MPLKGKEIFVPPCFGELEAHYRAMLRPPPEDATCVDCLFLKICCLFTLGKGGALAP